MPAILEALQKPGDRGAEGLGRHRAAGLANGLEAFEGSRIRTALPQLTHSVSAQD